MRPHRRPGTTRTCAVAAQLEAAKGNTPPLGFHFPQKIILLATAAQPSAETAVMRFHGRPLTAHVAESAAARRPVQGTGRRKPQPEGEDAGLACSRKARRSGETPCATGRRDEASGRRASPEGQPVSPTQRRWRRRGDRRDEDNREKDVAAQTLTRSRGRPRPHLRRPCPPVCVRTGAGLPPRDPFTAHTHRTIMSRA